MRLLILEDHQALCDELKRLCTNAGYHVVVSTALKQARKLELNFDLYILDINLKDGNGYDFCVELRNKGITQPILFLSSRNLVDEIVHGLKIGANDYITKPFEPAILLAKIEVLLRGKSKTQYLKSGDLTLNLMTYELYKNDNLIELTTVQFNIVKIMMEHSFQLLTRDFIICSLWEMKNQMIEDNTLSVHLSNIRKKIGFYQEQPYFKTQYGLGYKWVVEVYED